LYINGGILYKRVGTHDCIAAGKSRPAVKCTTKPDVPVSSEAAHKKSSRAEPS
jgi:hypothetical protein